MPKINCSLFIEESENRQHQIDLDRLSEKKISWDAFKKKAGDLTQIARLASSRNARTVLHLAVLDNELTIIEILSKIPHFRVRRDVFGLTPIDIARFLNRKEALRILQPVRPGHVLPQMPPVDGFEYLAHPIFESKEEFEQILKQVAKAKEEDKIPAEKIWMGIYFDKEIDGGIHPPVSVQFFDQHVGFGVFASQKISPCAYVGEYTGMIRQQSRKERQQNKYALLYNTWEGRERFAIDAELKGNFTRFINHSSRPNLGIQSVYWRGLSRMIFVALNEIAQGEQLTFDYGPIFWKDQPASPKQF